MSKQPLTNTVPAITVMGLSLEAIDHALQAYNFPSDPLDVTPTLTVHKVTSYVDLVAQISAGAVDMPCTVVGNVPSHWIIDARNFFEGGVVTMADALKMINNEYAIRRDQIQNGTVPQTPKRRDY